MADNVHPNDGTKAGPSLQTTRALADLGFNSMLAADAATSSEDEANEVDGDFTDGPTGVVGVSISREQTRLTSPTTPATEKAAAIAESGGFFGQFDGIVEEPEDQDEDIDNFDGKTGIEGRASQAGSTAEERRSRSPIPERSARRTSVRLPSPWRVEPSTKWQTPTKRRSGLFDGLFGRRRASSGGDSTLEGWQKLVMSSLPSLPSIPKQFSVSSPFSSTRTTLQDTNSTTTGESCDKPSFTDSGSSLHQRGHTDDLTSTANSQHRQMTESKRENSIDGSLARPTLQMTRSGAPLLRTSTSDNSLVTMRTLSTVASFGDDSRFTDVHAQVNSRRKAIRDSLQDSSIKLPSLSNFAPDFFRERSGSISKKRPSGQSPRQSMTASRGMSNQDKITDPMTRQPYTSAKAAVADTPDMKSSSPQFERALDQLEGDVVILGGYRGSILRTAEPPHRQLWVPVKVGLNLRKANLEVGIEEDSDQRALDTVIPGGMLTHIGPVDISRRLLRRMRSCENARTGKLRVHDYGYDWRLSPEHLSRQLLQFLDSLPCNKIRRPIEKRGATVIAHSLGGLITRHAVNQNPELFKGVVYAGVPHTCVNILGPLRNGDEVLLSSRVLTAQVNFTIRTSFALLPLDGRCFFDKETREEYPVDFFDPKTWIDYRLSPCVARPLLPLNVQPKPTGISGYVSSVASVLPSLPSLPLRGRKASLKTSDASKAAVAVGAEVPDMASREGGEHHADANGNIENADSETSSSVRTAVTLPHEKAVEYLTRTLAGVKRFKEDTLFKPAHAEMNRYPPCAVIYGKTTPTVYGAKVNGREGIKHADAYDELAFASGDGVVLARAAMVPDGYKTAKGGIVASDRGHVTLLGDLEAVGKCLNAVVRARRRGEGLGVE